MFTRVYLLLPLVVQSPCFMQPKHLPKSTVPTGSLASVVTELATLNMEGMTGANFAEKALARTPSVAAVALLPQEAGQFKFTCGMHRLRGSLVVK